MIRLLLEPVNLLILDEPTNHLDIPSKEVLKQAIKDFNGTVILVSHDRDFLDGLVEKVYEFGEGKVRECLGGIYEFLEKKKLESLDLLGSRNMAQAAGTHRNDTPSPVQTAAAEGPTKHLHGNCRMPNRRSGSARRAVPVKKVEDAEAQIAALEKEVKDIEAKMAGGEYSQQLMDEHQNACKRLDNAMSIWELAQEELDACDNLN